MDMIGTSLICRSAGRAITAALIGFALFGAAPLISPAAADEAKAITGAQDTNKPGLVAEIIECKRQAGVLSVQMRLRNTTDKDVDAQIIDIRNFHQYYVTAGAKKYLIMEDSDRVPLSSPANSSGSFSARIPKGGSWVWWAKYTAPPADVKAISYYTPLAPPFDNVPISD
jgi:hypothetical protein